MGAPQVERLYIASWNVAGWLTTVKHIKANHKQVDDWFKRHDFDILCLQEVKTSDKNIENQPREHVVSPDGYDSFWAPSRLRNAKGGLSGMAGVATFIKRGLCRRAHRDALDNGGPLDQEGRCLVTYVGNFAIFNVYIPNDGSFSVNLPLKLKVLHALRHAMLSARRQGFQVILCGDLNLSYRARDVCPLDRRVDITECLRLAALIEGSPEREHFTLHHPRCFEMCQQLALAWGGVQQVLSSRRAEQVEIYVPSQNRKETKWRIFVDVASVPDASTKQPATKKVALGKPTSKEIAQGGPRGAFQVVRELFALLVPKYKSTSTDARTNCLQLTPRRLLLAADAAAPPPEAAQHADDAAILSHPGNTLRVEELTEILEKACGIKWGPQDVAALANSPVSNTGSSIQASQWMQSVLSQASGIPDESRGHEHESTHFLIDSFAALHPAADARYTCWCQYTNERYRYLKRLLLLP